MILLLIQINVKHYERTITTNARDITKVSDKNKKENFTAIDGKDILEKLATLSITQWNYKGESASIKHIGPMAQDFYSLFHLGTDEKSISSLDKTGVALIAIQALEKRTAELQKELDSKDKEMDLLKADNQELHNQLNEIKMLLQQNAQSSELKK